MALSIQPCPGSSGTVYTTASCIHDSASGTYEEIISTGSGGPGGATSFCTKSQSVASGMAGTAWAQKCYTYNSNGDLYSIYGNSAMPYTAGGQPAQQGQRAVSSADPQYFAYLEDSQPGAYSRKMQRERVMPWYTNTFGTMKSNLPQPQPVQDEEESKEGLIEWIREVFEADSLDSTATEIPTSIPLMQLLRLTLSRNPFAFIAGGAGVLLLAGRGRKN